ALRLPGLEDRMGGSASIAITASDGRLPGKTHSPAQAKAPALPTRRTFDQREREVLAEREMTWQR
ncbi:hypothetical protein AB0N20_36250, partial [Streptomyces griseoincarnatus]